MSRSFTRPASPQTDDQTSAENRRKLEALFSGGGVASLSRAPLLPQMRPAVSAPRRGFANPRRAEGRPMSDYKLRLEYLRNASEPGDIERAADAFLKHHTPPDDMGILLKLLQHPSEKVQRDAMGEIHALLIQRRVQNTFLLTDRLGEMAARELEPATRQYVQGLMDLVAQRAKEA